jgi:hypothetical protein
MNCVRNRPYLSLGSDAGEKCTWSVDVAHVTKMQSDDVFNQNCKATRAIKILKLEQKSFSLKA